jgi:uncharacterized protein YdhG (YjbR/CyaY superfamily)
MKKPLTVDEYIANCRQEYQPKLQQLRKIIKETAPKAEEKLSYAMPYYGYKGRLAYFALAKNFIGLYLMPPTIEDHREELKKYATTKSSLHLPLDSELPIALIKKLIRVGVKRNESKHLQ